MVGYRGGLMLEIKKIWGDTYLVNGEYLTQDFNEAVVLAYENKEKMKKLVKFENISNIKFIIQSIEKKADNQ